MVDLFWLGLVLILIWAFLLITVESYASPQKKEKLIGRLLQERYRELELIFQTTFVVALFLFCFPPALTFEDIVISIDLTIFPFYIAPTFVVTIHRRLRHFRDLVEGRIMGSSGETLERLEPTMYARMSLVYWVVSVVALVCFLVLKTSGVYPVIATVLFHYGLIGLGFFTSPLLFSLGSLRRKPTKTDSSISIPMSTRP